MLLKGLKLCSPKKSQILISLSIQLDPQHLFTPGLSNSASWKHKHTNLKKDEGTVRGFNQKPKPVTTFRVTSLKSDHVKISEPTHGTGDVGFTNLDMIPNILSIRPRQSKLQYISEDTRGLPSHILAGGIQTAYQLHP
ncbi:hypothetical protein E2C01_084955 [Portunus trituberculatus]|uniref:Uncharacterized protein n=1 Tax=Portunus trituberculatus TaxID=210409 RepID=A0A5B7J5H0_PORTR|nr:hypothetical protein [Portunus trituberculatus]